MTDARTGREILRINNFEKEWRIRTNFAKFSVIPLATRTPAPLTVDGDDVGLSMRLSQRVSRAKAALPKLYRFRALATGLQLHLIKALVLPILTYLPVPLHVLSKPAISRFQEFQNSALRFAFVTR